ncbi:MAG: exodeoxyribonuclease VII large subunit [Firmicutes bacterium]|nr:exodeoxyribonuclease VII large subunit [Bacillota bacterium]
MSDNYFSVAQINSYIKNIFEAEIMLQNICVYGEVSSYNVSNGIAYFNIKDESGLLSCVLFGAKNFDTPNIGDVILVKGSMSYYAKGGKLSFNATSIMPYGKGLLYEKFLKLKAKLQELGYFDEARKRPVPKRVRRIGVVSSPTGAVIRDIIDVTHRRNDTIDIVLYPVKVQGVGADAEISQGIKFFSDYEKVDVIIVARGGGSAEDLEPFNSEIVANATFESKKPVVSAVGHETDFTIIDFVADLRAPTPSAAAELVAWRKDLEIENIAKYTLSIEKNLKNKFTFIQKDIDIFYEKLDNIASNKIMKQTIVLDRFVVRLQEFENIVDKKTTTLDKYNLSLIGSNPEKISKMGYSKVFQDDKVINSVKKLKDGKIIVSMIDGQIESKI